ncbi:unnamed protein product [Nippostrongylus brasiliensis]|uniref:Metalloendopeptidase n=1 Tax=Nippostrongylus brasiliensis TaxID=27835 RepID=A0A158QXT0_NIPBR|nr:unnamed protein product [Nippostrongylus brasiliensis]
MQNLHRASVGSGPATTPLPKPDLGPKNNYSLPISVTNKKLGTVTHEIAHALGFYHTQSRYDRDSWVHVDLANVDPTLLSNFAKVSALESILRLVAILATRILEIVIRASVHVLSAYSTSWATLQGQAGDPNSYVPTQDPTDCFWHIQAPPGRRIQLRLSASPQVCMEGCPWQSVEINLGQFDLYGMLMCCPSSIGQTYTSTGSLVTIRGAVRVNELTFAVDYRVV